MEFYALGKVTLYLFGCHSFYYVSQYLFHKINV
jgi:hypothetical protein